MEAKEVLEVADSPNNSVLEHSVNDSSKILIIDIVSEDDCEASFKISPAKNIKLQNHSNPVSDYVDSGKRAATYGTNFNFGLKKDGEEGVKMFMKSSSSGLEKKEAEVFNLNVGEYSEDSGSIGVHGQVLYESDGSVGNADSQSNLSKLPLFGSIEENHRMKRKVNESAIDMQATAKERLPKLMSLDTLWRNMMCDKPAHDGNEHQFSTWGSEIPYTAIGKHAEKNISGEIFSSFATMTSQGSQKERDVHNVLQEVPSMKGGHKGSMHSCFVFPDADRYGKSMNVTRDTSISSISCAEFEETRKVGEKGKVRPNDITAEYVKKTKLKAQCPRKPGGHATLFAGDEICASLKDIGQRARHDKGKPSISSFSESGTVFGTGDVSRLSDQSPNLASGDADLVNLSHDNPYILNRSLNSVTSGFKSQTKCWHEQHNQVMGNKYCRSVHSHFDECSAFPRNNLGTSCIQLQFSGQASNQWSGLHRSQEEDCSEYDGLKQRDLIESDEILARKLQEEFDRELEAYGRKEERDAAMEQMDEDEHDSPLEISYQQSANAAVGQSSDMRHQQRRIFDSSAFDLEMSLVSELSRSFSTADMDSEMKAKLFEALEFAFQKSNVAVSEAYHPETDDLNEDDYEIVMLHKEDNHACAASEVEINSLPHSVIQSDDSKEACAVCLELPSAGDVIRHLRCLHKFHKECIDTWLRRKASCPVCKSRLF